MASRATLSPPWEEKTWGMREEGREGHSCLEWSIPLHKGSQDGGFRIYYRKETHNVETVIFLPSWSHSSHLDLSKKYHTVLSQTLRSNSVSKDVGMRREGANQEKLKGGMFDEEKKDHLKVSLRQPRPWRTDRT